MHRLKDSPLNPANCLERDKTKMCSTSCEINSKMRVAVTLWLSELPCSIRPRRLAKMPALLYGLQRGGRFAKACGTAGVKGLGFPRDVMNMADKAIL